MSYHSLQQQLEAIAQQFEFLSQHKSFEELNKATQVRCDVSLSDSWQGIESAIQVIKHFQEIEAKSKTNE